MTSLYKTSLSAASVPSGVCGILPKAVSPGSLRPPVIQQPYSQPAFHTATHTQRQLLNQYNPPAPATTFTLPVAVTVGIPQEVLQRVMHCREGNMLFFSIPPLLPSSDQAGNVGHSTTWLGRKREIQERQKKHTSNIEHEKSRKKIKIEQDIQTETKSATDVMIKALELLASI